MSLGARPRGRGPARGGNPGGARARRSRSRAISSRSRSAISKAARRTRQRSPGSLRRSPRAPPRAAIREVHSVRVRETPAGLVVNYHCRVEPALNVAAVHELVDDLERRSGSSIRRSCASSGTRSRSERALRPALRQAGRSAIRRPQSSRENGEHAHRDAPDRPPRGLSAERFPDRSGRARYPAASDRDAGPATLALRPNPEGRDGRAARARRRRAPARSRCRARRPRRCRGGLRGDAAIADDPTAAARGPSR